MACCEVWKFNLEQEIERLRDAADNCGYVALETLTPGTIARPQGPFEDYAEYNYQTLKCNVDLTKVIQLSLCLLDEEGHRADGVSTWRFNFEFNSAEEQITAETAERLRRGCGVDLSRHHAQGISARLFGELLMSSGLVLNENIRWIVFYGASSFAERERDPRQSPWITFNGIYSLGYLLQLLTTQPLPDKTPEFCESLDLYFPFRCDVARHLTQSQLQQLAGADPSDPLRRPLYCSSHNLLEAYFSLPEPLRAAVSENGGQPPIFPESGAAPEEREPPRRSRRKSKASGAKRKSSRHAAATADGHHNEEHCDRQRIPHALTINGVAKTGGG